MIKTNNHNSISLINSISFNDTFDQNDQNLNPTPFVLFFCLYLTHRIVITIYINTFNNE